MTLTASNACSAPISTTSASESVNSVIRKFTRNRKQDPKGEPALKLVDLATHEVSKKCTMPIVGWNAAVNYFAILCEDRLPRSAENERAKPGSNPAEQNH